MKCIAVSCRIYRIIVLRSCYNDALDVVLKLNIVCRINRAHERASLRFHYTSHISLDVSPTK